jgi:hypothetical protein
LSNHRISELLLQGLGLVEAIFELVAQRHQFIDFFDDAVLFGERGNRD